MIQNTTKEKIENEYFEWMYHLVCSNNYYNKLSYRKLLHHMHSIKFLPLVDMDENRAVDGIDFRFRFGLENGYSNETIEEHLGTNPCSILEMIIALAFKVEEQITDNNCYGNRTGQWFWNMMVSLNLGQMNDKDYDALYCDNVLYRFLYREYSPDGKGGLFTLNNPNKDMRSVDIWCQFMWYLNENFIE